MGSKLGNAAFLALIVLAMSDSTPPAKAQTPTPAPAGISGKLALQVAAAESSFAATMAARDHEAFGGFVSKEAVFFGRRVLRGHDAVVAGWKPLFEEKDAPFSWKPDQVEVLDSGTLALSSGPVMDPDGKITGRFNSIWRLESDGRWRVIFDKGSPVCDETK